MLTEQLIQLVDDIRHKKCEMQNIELKRAEYGTPKKLYDTLSSFSNQYGGGIIIFGISEKDQFKVTGVYDPQDIQVKVTEQALQMQPVVRPLFTVAQYEGEIIVSAEISECDIYDKPCFYTGLGRIRGSFIRVGESDQPMTEFEVYSYEAFKRKIQEELNIVERADLQDFDQDALDEFYFKLRKMKPNLSKLNLNEIMRLQGLILEGKPTTAGMLLFGKYPQAFFPQLSITAMVIAGTDFGGWGTNEVRFIDNRRIEGTLQQMLDEAIVFVRRSTRTATVITDQGKRADRPEYPEKAIREIILNALIHRDYSKFTDGIPIRIILYDDRIEIENPGSIYGNIPVSQLGKIAVNVRNPYIASVLEVLIDTENRFSGIPTIYNEMEAAGLEPPVFESNQGTFKVTLYNDSILKGKKHTAEAGMEGVESSNGDGKGAASDIPSRILAFCSTPRSREEIAAMLHRESTYYVVTRYIRPLVEKGQLKMTLPDTPKSKKQKYYTP